MCTSSKNKDGDGATVSVDTVSLEGRRWWKGSSQAWGVGAVPASGADEGGVAFPYSSLTRREVLRLLGLLGQELWGGAHFTQLAASAVLIHPEGLASAFSTPLWDSQAGSFWNFNWELVVSHPPPHHRFHLPKGRC